MELAHFYANSNQALWDAQEKYEANVLKYVEARDFWSQASYEYKKAFSREVGRLGGERDSRITIIKERATLACLDEYKAMIDAETIKKKFRYFIEVGKEKIQTYKALMKQARDT